MNNCTKIIIADDHPLMCEGLSHILEENSSYKVIDVVHNGLDLIRVLNNKKPHLVLFDFSMPILDGIEASIEIRKKFPRIKLIGISMRCDDRILQKLIDIGVHGFIPKMSDSTIFLSVIERVLGGDVVYLNQNDTQIINGENENSVQDSVDKHKLSARELEILQLIKNGMTSKEIAETINLSYYTIETHRKRISKKLNVSSNHGLLKFALEHL